MGASVFYVDENNKVREIKSIAGIPGIGTLYGNRNAAKAEADKRIKMKQKPLIPGIKNVIYSGEATIVFWEDGIKTVVRCQPDDEWDGEKGVLECIAKRAYGNGNKFNDVVKNAVWKGSESLA